MDRDKIIEEINKLWDPVDSGDVFIKWSLRILALFVCAVAALCLYGQICINDIFGIWG